MSELKFYSKKINIIPHNMLIPAPANTSRIKCTPASILDSAIKNETERAVTPKSKLTYNIAIAIINALAV